jgi:hypothetical protein
VEAAVEMEGESPTLGSTVVYHVRTTLPAGWELKLPESYDFPPGFRVVKEGISLKRTPVAGGEEFDLAIPLLVMRLGRLKIEDKTFLLSGPGGQTAQATVGRVVLNTGSLFPDENEPAPAAAVGPVPVLERNWLMIWTLAILGVVAVAVTVTLLVLNRKRKREKPAAPARPAHEVALEKLKALDEKRLDLAGEFAAYYTALSEILREYLGGRFGFDSLDMTTTELVERLRRARLENFLFEGVSFQLQEFDLVKFAKMIPTQSRCREDLDRVRQFVEATLPPPVPEAPASARGPEARASAGPGTVAGGGGNP